MTLFRDPISRVLSHLNDFFSLGPLTLGTPLLPKEAVHTDTFFSRVARSSCSSADLRKELINWDYVETHNVTLPDRFFKHDWSVLCGIVENYQSRSLVGSQLGAEPYSKQGYNWRDQNVSDASCHRLARHAIRVMLQFKLVLTLDDIGDAGPLLEQHLGWSNTTVPDVNVGAAADYFKWDLLSAQQQRALNDLNCADAVLYASAREQFRLDLSDLPLDLMQQRGRRHARAA